MVVLSPCSKRGREGRGGSSIRPGRLGSDWATGPRIRPSATSASPDDPGHSLVCEHGWSLARANRNAVEAGKEKRESSQGPRGIRHSSACISPHLRRSRSQKSHRQHDCAGQFLRVITRCSLPMLRGAARTSRTPPPSRVSDGGQLGEKSCHFRQCRRLRSSRAALAKALY